MSEDRPSASGADSTIDDGWGWARSFRDSIYFEYLQVIVVAFVIVFGFIRPFLVEPYKIPSGSMEDTLLTGDRVLVVRFLYGVKLPGTSRRLFSYRPPERGDVFVFMPKHDSDTNYIKRIIAIGGDTVSVDGRTLILNSERVADEPYTKHGRRAGDFPPFRQLVPYFWEAPGAREEVAPFGTRTEVQTQLGESGGPVAFDLEGKTYRVNIGLRNRERAREIPVGKYYYVRAERERAYREGFLYENKNSFKWYFVEPLTRSRYRRLHPDGGSFTVPDRHMFAMGDNRSNSEDSRSWGPVPFDAVKGKAVLVYWSTTPGEPFWNLFKWLRIGRFGKRITTHHVAVGS